MNIWDKIFDYSKQNTLEQAKVFFKKNNLETNIKIINVVGTNGKGSVSTYLCQGIESTGKKVGLFTGPHIAKPNERIQIHGVNISSKEAEEIYNSLEGIEELNFFTSLVAIAMAYFIKNKVDIIILEAGIGGTRDVTSCFANYISVLTSIGYDHADIFDNNLKKMTEDKIGITREGMTLYYPSVLKGSLQRLIQKSGISSKKIINTGSDFDIRNRELAIGVLRAIGVKFNQFKEIKGRCSTVKDKYIIDVSHNLDGIKASLIYLKNNAIEFDSVFVAMKLTKETKGLKKLFPKNIKMYTKKIDEHFHDLKDKRIIEINDFSEIKTEKKILFIGSFKVAKMLLEWSGK